MRYSINEQICTCQGTKYLSHLVLFSRYRERTSDNIKHWKTANRGDCLIRKYKMIKNNNGKFEIKFLTCATCLN